METAGNGPAVKEGKPAPNSIFLNLGTLKVSGLAGTTHRPHQEGFPRGRDGQLSSLQ